MTPSVLVTGARGFIGRHVAKEFASDGWIVDGLGHGDWRPVEREQWGIRKWHKADVSLDSLCEYAPPFDVIVHCAGSGSVRYSLESPYDDFQKNVTTTLSVLEFVRTKQRDIRVIYPSSAAVYGDTDATEISECEIRQPVSPYGRNKIIAEDLCRSYAEHFGLRVSLVRLFSVYGPGLRKQLLWDASNKVHRRDTVFDGTGEEVRDLLHVSDAARLLKSAAAHASSECPVVNGGSGRGLSVRSVLTDLFKAFNQICSPSFSGHRRLGDPRRYVADITKALAWGWNPEVQWSDGIRAYADWYTRDHS